MSPTSTTLYFEYADGSPNEAYTGATGLTIHDGVVEFHGTIGGVTDDWVIPLSRIKRIRKHSV